MAKQKFECTKPHCRRGEPSVMWTTVDHPYRGDDQGVRGQGLDTQLRQL